MLHSFIGPGGGGGGVRQYFTWSKTSCVNLGVKFRSYKKKLLSELCTSIIDKSCELYQQRLILFFTLIARGSTLIVKI